MKKIILGILSLVYLAIASGVVIGTHYCMGRITDSGYAFRIDDKCSKCGMNNKDGCCHTEFKIVKLGTDQQEVKANFDFNLPFVAIINHSSSYLQPKQGSVKNRISVNHAPPDFPDSPLYLFNSVFRI